jgi:hypothetical protein
MDSISLTQAIAKLRRDQPRNALTMMVCDELMARLMVTDARTEARADEVKKALKFDRNAYQRAYMKKWRAKKNLKKL